MYQTNLEMKAAGLRSFDIPTDKSQSTEGAKARFQEYWGRPFKGDDDDVRYIAKLVPSHNEICRGQRAADAKETAPFGTTSRCLHMLWLMMEMVGAQESVVH